MVTGHGMRWIVRGVVAAVVAGACSGEPNYIPCLRSENCLAPLECIGGLCMKADAGEGDAGDGDAGDGDAGEGGTDGGPIYIDPCGTTNVGTSAQDGGAEEGVWSSWNLLLGECCSELCGESGTTCVPNGCDGATVRGPTQQYLLLPNVTFVGSATCGAEEDLPTWSGDLCGELQAGQYQCCCAAPTRPGVECPPSPSCTPGNERPCACADGSEGTEICGADRLYRSCEVSCPCDPGGPCDCGGGPGTATCGPDGTCLCGSWIETHTTSSSCADVCASQGTTCVPRGCNGSTLKFQHYYTGPTPSSAPCDADPAKYFTTPVVACCCSAPSSPDASGATDAGDASNAG